MTSYIVSIVTLLFLTYSSLLFGQFQRTPKDLGIKDSTILMPKDSTMQRIFSVKYFYNQDSATIEEDEKLFYHYFAKIIGLDELSDSTLGSYFRIWNWDIKDKFVV